MIYFKASKHTKQRGIAMDNKAKAMRILSIFLGVSLLAAGIFVFVNFKDSNYDGKTTGVITELAKATKESKATTRFLTYIDYSVQGQKYEHVRYPKYSSFMEVGDEVDVYYMTSDPSQIADSNRTIFPLVGIASALFGFVTLAFEIVKAVKRRQMPGADAQEDPDEDVVNADDEESSAADA